MSDGKNEYGYLSLIEAAQYLHLSVGTFRDFVRTKNVPHYKPGKVLLFKAKDLDGWMSGYRQGHHGLALTGLNRRP